MARTDASGKTSGIHDTCCGRNGCKRTALLGDDHRLVNAAAHPLSVMKTPWWTAGRGRVLFAHDVSAASRSESLTSAEDVCAVCPTATQQWPGPLASQRFSTRCLRSEPRRLSYGPHAPSLAIAAPLLAATQALLYVFASHPHTGLNIMLHICGPKLTQAPGLPHWPIAPLQY